MDKKTWLINGKPLDKNKTYTVAFSDYLLKGFDIPFLKPSNSEVYKIIEPKKEDLNNDIRKSVIAFLKKAHLASSQKGENKDH